MAALVSYLGVYCDQANQIYSIKASPLRVCVHVLEDEQREKSLSHHTIQQLILEKDQALADLNSVEKSLADLFRRYEKMKDVLEGFRKVKYQALKQSKLL